MKINKILESLRRELILWQSLTFDLIKFVDELKDIDELNDFERKTIKGFRKLYDYLVGTDEKRNEAEIKEKAKKDMPIFFKIGEKK